MVARQTEQPQYRLLARLKWDDLFAKQIIAKCTFGAMALIEKKTTAAQDPLAQLGAAGFVMRVRTATKRKRQLSFSSNLSGASACGSVMRRDILPLSSFSMYCPTISARQPCASDGVSVLLP